MADPCALTQPRPELASVLAFGEDVAQEARRLNARLLALTTDAARPAATGRGWLAALGAATGTSSALSRLGRTIAMDARAQGRRVDALTQLHMETVQAQAQAARCVQAAAAALDAWRNGAPDGLDAQARSSLVTRLEQRHDHLAGLIVSLQQGERTAAALLASERSASATLEEARDVTQPLALRRRASEELASDVRRTASAFAGVDDFAQGLLAEDRRRLDQTLRGRP